MLHIEVASYMKSCALASTNIVKTCDGDHFIIVTDSLSSLQALDSNNCDHPFIQDI